MSFVNPPGSLPASPPCPGLLGRIASIPAGRRTKWLMIPLWIVMIVLLSPLAGKLGDVEQNDAEAWLPANAESLAVTRQQEALSAGSSEEVSAAIVFQRDGGLTEADRAYITAQRETLAGIYTDVQLGPDLLSADGQALLFTLPMPPAAIENDDLVTDIVKDTRALLADHPDGLTASVSGSAGVGSDMMSVLDGLDTTLLLASALVVAVLLLLTYRSPIVWIVPLLSVAVATQLAFALVYLLADVGGQTVNGQSSGILPVLVFGAGTDYALLLIARYREELRRHEDKHVAMAVALRRAGPAIVASAATVVLGLLCLLVADMNPTAGLGPVGAAGIVAALLAMLTLLPAILVIFGRRLFWPFIPRFGDVIEERSGLWSRVGSVVSRRPRIIWATTVLALLMLVTGLFSLDLNLPQDEQLISTPDSIVGARIITAHYAGGASQPNVLLANASAADAVLAAASAVPGVSAVEPDDVAPGAGRVAYAVTLDAVPGSSAAYTTIEQLRDAVHAIPGAEALVGGPDAIGHDTAVASARDEQVIMPLVLIVVFLVLCVLLRAIVAPLVLMATVVLSYAAALGTAVLMFKHVFGFGGMDPSIPLLSFVFLIALGIDYNIFLMGRVHEESARLGTRRGMLHGLSVTGGVITSAGLVLAATFGTLGVMPMVFMAELGFIVAFGVLLDTIVVRSILVPALTFDIGPRMWWPSGLARAENPTTAGATAGATGRRKGQVLYGVKIPAPMPRPQRPAAPSTPSAPAAPSIPSAVIVDRGTRNPSVNGD